MSCIPFAVHPGSFILLADGTSPTFGSPTTGWTEILPGTSVPPIPSSATTITLNASKALTIQAGAGPVSPMVSYATADHVYFLRFGNGNGVLILSQGTSPSTGSVYFIGVNLYLPATNIFNPVLSTQDLNIYTFPAVRSSTVDGALILFSYQRAAGVFSPVQIACELIRSDNGHALYNSPLRPISDWSFLATPNPSSPPTSIQIFTQGVISGSTHLTDVALPCMLEYDFYIRDWTDSVASADTGSEPSTHPDFYSTSDIWNRQTMSDGFPTPNDQPAGENAIAGVSNYVFTRVSRKASGPLTLVDITFFSAPFGSGSNFSFIGTETLHYPDNTTVVICAGLAWDPPAVASPHYCLAMEIESPNDTLTTHLAGSAPGPADPLILNDNNKAQRNLVVVRAPHFPRIPPSDKAREMVHYAIIHNPSVFPRNMSLKFAPSPEAQKHISQLGINVINSDRKNVHPGETIELYDMQPGENRWIELHFTLLDGPLKKQIPIHFREMNGEKIVNGFCIAIQPSLIEDCIAANLSFHKSVMNRLRLLSAQKVQVKKGETDLKRMDEKLYFAYLAKELTDLKHLSASVMTNADTKDLFAAGEAINDLAGHHSMQDVYSTVIAHSNALHKIDAYLTMETLSKGNPADILQNVRMQLHLYDVVPQLSKLPEENLQRNKLVTFVSNYPKHKENERLYAKLISELMILFDELTSIFESEKSVMKLYVSEMKKHPGDIQSLQKNHLSILRVIQSEHFKNNSSQIQTAGKKNLVTQ